MIIGRIEGSTRVCGKSQGFIGLPLRDENTTVTECIFYGLPIFDIIADDKVTGPETNVMVTAWLPTPDEIERIQAGAPVLVRMIGKSPLPMNVLVGEKPE